LLGRQKRRLLPPGGEANTRLFDLSPIENGGHRRLRPGPGKVFRQPELMSVELIAAIHNLQVVAFNNLNQTLVYLIKILM